MEKINEFMHICIEELQLFYTKSDRGKKILLIASFKTQM